MIVPTQTVRRDTGNKRRVFADILNSKDFEIYLVKSSVGNNRHDSFHVFEVNGVEIGIEVSGEITYELNRLQDDIWRGNDGHRFFTEEELRDKQIKYEKGHRNLYEGVAYTLCDIWRSQQFKIDTINKEK